MLIDRLKHTPTQRVEEPDEASRFEIKKVIRRLKMWSRPDRQSQYNSQILNAYLELKRSGKNNITEEEIFKHSGAKSWFWPNYVQMKVSADRNHGKIFAVDGRFVDVWEPVKSAVAEYERVVFGGKEQQP